MENKGVLLIVATIVSVILVFSLLMFYNPSLKISGNVASEDSQGGEGGAVPGYGPSAEEQSCMMTCMGCSSPGVGCTGNQEQCQAQCNVEKPEQTEEEKCVEECALQGCDQYDFKCQSANQVKCDEQCGMIKEPEAKSEEEQCIRDCVQKEDPDLICKPGEGGEKGNELCQKCAKDCEYLYAGPCMMEMELEEKKKSCETCEHCYGEPVTGNSGEGYECIIDVKCGDASAEFGDEPGTEGIIAKAGDAIGSVVESIGDFFSNLFGGGDEETETPGSRESTA